MRQFFLYAMMMAGVLASCSQNENEGLPDNEPVDLTPSAEPIMISAASPSVVVNTRSAGSIGADGASDPTNTWSGQDLYIFAKQLLSFGKIIRLCISRVAMLMIFSVITQMMLQLKLLQ